MILLFLGIIIYIIAVQDILKTTLSMQGGGWLTNNFSKMLWKICFYLSGENGASKFLGKSGYIILTGIIIFWVFLLWTSLSLLIYSDPLSVVSSSDKTPVLGFEKLYFAGYILSTLGNGEYIPGSDFWRLITNIFSFTGLVLLTMSVTYFVPLLQAVIEQQKLAVQISGYGETPQQMLLNTYDGQYYQGLTANASELTLALIKHTQNHKAYPVIHYFHNDDKEYNIILELSKLYKCLVILENLLSEEHSPKESELRSLNVAFDNYFKVITQITNTKKSNNLNITGINTDQLIKNGLAETGKELPKNIQGLQIFYKLVKNDGWNWENVI